MTYLEQVIRFFSFKMHLGTSTKPRPLPERLVLEDTPRLLKLIAERDAEIVKLKADCNRQGDDYVRLYRETFPLRKQVEAARDTLRLYECGCKRTSSCLDEQCGFQAQKTLAYLERLEKE